ncbi:MAG: hypothetical protein QE278_10750 [Limnobacter sp.]|nr:hypothetical protein [Limnobacter sp.]
MKNLNLKHQSSVLTGNSKAKTRRVVMLYMPLTIALCALLLLAPSAFAAGYPEVPRPIDTSVQDIDADSYDANFSDLSVAPLSRAKGRGNRHLGKALREIGRVDLTGTAWSGAALASSGMPSGRLDTATLEEPLGGQFESGVLEQRGLENGGKFETNGFETPLKGWFSSNPEVPVAFKYRHPVRR